MSLLFDPEGFEGITSAQLARRGWTVANSSFGIGPVVSSGAANGPGQGLDLTGVSSSVLFSEDTVARSFAATPTILCGFDFQRVSSSSGDSRFLYFKEGGTTHLIFVGSETGVISVYRGDGTLLGSSSAFVFAEDAFSYVEAEATIHDTTGAVRVVVDGDEVLSLSNTDTRNGGAVGTVDTLALACSTAGFPTENRHYFDHVYALDDAGVVLNELLGPVRIDEVLVTANSGSPQFTPSAGSNYQNVDESTPNDDTDYNESVTDGHIDDFVLANLPDDSLAIYAVTVRSMAKRTDASAASIANRLTSGATTVVGTPVALSSSYQEVSDTYTVNPDTSNEWDDAAISALIAGYERPA